MTFRRAAALVAATSMLVGGLAACGDEEPTQPTTTASPIDKGTDSPSETSSPSASSSKGGAGELPSAAQKRTKAGAIAFTKSWFESSGDAFQGEDFATLEAHTHKDCAVCWNLIDRIREDQQKGITADRDAIDTEGFSATERADNGYRVEFTMKNPAYSKVNESGEVLEKFEKSSVTVVTDTHWTKNGWTLKGWIIK